MKLHLPVKLFRAVLACMAAVSFVSFTSATSTCFAATEEEENELLMLLAEQEYPNGSIIYTTRQTSAKTLTGYESILFKDISSSTEGGAIANLSTFTLSGNGNVTFSGNSASASYGGAIYNSSNGTFTLNGNGDVTFSGNSAKDSGAIHNYGTFTLSGNGAVTFSGNSARDGGAIYNSSNGTFTLSGNETVTFSGNAETSKSGGGAIFNYGTFTLSGNGAVTFSGNSAKYGGAIYNLGTNATFTLSDNEAVTFSGNTASYGGAIENSGTFTLSGNGAVTFSENTASGLMTSGGAIYNSGTFTLSGNGDVSFSGNTDSYDSGAIYNRGTFTLSGNGDVLFERNAVGRNGSYRLRSIYSTATLNLASLEGKSITFRDSLYASGTVNLNQDYTDTEGVVHKSTGDIIFTGATTEADLREVKGGVDGTATEITNSRTSEIATMTNLYAGRLIVEDKAILKGQGITAAADSGATVRVKDGALNHSGYALTFNNSTKLEAEGASSITASTVAMKAGSTLSFVVGEANLTTAALTLTGTLTTETISLAISGIDVSEQGRYTYALMKASSYDTSAWTADKITVVTEGVSFENMVWKDGTLYLNYIPDLTAATWNNASGDGLWNASSINWTQDGYSYAYADGVDVIFGNEGAGTVSLVGNLAPKSVLINNGGGFDYTFAGTGKLTGTTSLTKQGEGKLTINTANDYTGGTAINGGTLVAGNAAALGTGTVTLNSGTLEIATNGFINDITFVGDSSLMVDEGFALVLNKRIANSSYNLSLGGSITFKDISSTSDGGAISNDATFLLNGKGDATFSGNMTSSSYGGAIYNSGINATFTLSDNSVVAFSGNMAASSSSFESYHSFGGSIYNGDNAAFTINYNGDVTFSGNTLSVTSSALYPPAYGGGAIYNENNATFTLSDNGDVTFSGNTASAILKQGGNNINSTGGAISSEGVFTLSNNGVVTFSNNTATVDGSYGSAGYGGAICNYGTFTLSGNEGVTFSDNKATSYCNGKTGTNSGGGAISNAYSATFTLSDNGDVTFSENMGTSTGGAISSGGVFTLSNNGKVAFSGNSVEIRGGAIKNLGTFTLRGNSDVTFRGNTVSSDSAPYVGGGAITNEGSATFTLSDNGDVTFSGNRGGNASGPVYGGAINSETHSTLTLRGNGDVLFEKNAEVSNGSYRLRSIFSSGTLNLASSDGKSILFKDSIYAKGTVNLNQDYTDGEGVVHKSTGDIIFTGATTEADLREVKGGVDGTETEILNSRTSEIATMTNLYAGRLIVEDKAILKGKGITAAADSGATVRVKDGTLNHSGYALTFNNSTKLEAEGASSITASTVAMKAGSTLSFVVGEANLTTAALTLTGTLTTETISLAISGIDVSEQGRYTYALMKASSYNTSAWTADKITVVTEGVSFDDLVWKNGTLYLNYANLPTLTTATWNNGSGDGKWNAASLNWTQDGYSYAYADGVDVIFGSEGAGTVSLVGDLAPQSVLINNGSGFDFTFAGSGKLTGATALTKQGAGKLTINTANDYTGGTAIKGGTLVVGNAAALGTGAVAVNGGTLEIAASGLANDTSFAGNSALVVDAGYQLALSKMLANSGVLTVSGTLNASSLTLNSTAATHVDVNGNSGASGFAKGAIYSVQVVNGGTTSGAAATITHLNLPTGETLVLGENGIANAGGVVDYSNYLLVDATTSVSAIHGVAGASAATITQQGGTLTVDGDATVTTTAGNIALTSGTLSGTISGANISSTSGAATIAAAISGASSVSVDGGSLTLAGANTYTGATTVTAGTLTVTGSLSGDIALNGGTLNTGSGMTLSNQTLALQGGSVVGNMVLGTGGLLSVEQVSGQTGNLTLGGGTIALSGKKLTLSGALTIGADSVLKLESGYTQEGEYELLGYGSLSGDLKQLQLAAISTTQETRQNYTLSSDGSVLKLTVDGNALVLNWAGGEGTWQSLGSTEWLLPESVSAADKRFHENDSVVFASGGNVTLVGELKPTAVTVGGTQNVSFGGSGSIVGATTLTKEGSSTLTMNAVNAYTGGTTISAGVVNAGGAASFGCGEIALQGGELNLGNHAVANVIQATGGKLSGSAYAGTAYVNGAVSVGDATQLAALVLNGGSISGGSLTNTAITANNGTINSSITGSSAVVSHGTVTLAGTNTYTGCTTIDGGELTVTGSVAGNINLTAGVLNTAAGMTLASGQTLYMAGGSVTGDLSLSAGSRAEVNAATTITGGLTLNGGTLAVSDKLLTLTGMLTVGAESVLDVSGYTTEGTYTLMQYAGLSGDVNDLVMPVDVNGTSRLNYTLSNSGTALVLTLDGNALTLTWKGGNGTWGTLDDQEWDLPEGVSVANARFYAADSVLFTKGGTVTVSGEVMPGHVLVNSAENLTLIGSGCITGATSLTKQGNGTLTLNAANTYSGGTAISAGVVNAGGAGSFGSGKIALSGGELNLGAYAVTNAVEATGGKLSGTAYNGKLTVTGAVKLGNDTTANSVELVSGSLSEGSLTNTTVNATAGSIGSRVTGTSTVNVNGNVTLSGANTYTGRTTLSGGTLTAGSITAFGTGLVVVDAGTLNLGGYAVSNTVNAQSGTLTNGGAYAGTLNVNGNVALGGATTAAAVVLNSGSLTGGTLTSQAITAKGGTLGSKLTGACNVDISGTVSITGSNDYTGRTTVSSGQLNVGNASALGTSAVALKGGVLNLNGKAAGNAVTATAGTLSGATAYTGALTVKGDLTLAGVTTAGSMALEEGSINGGSIKDTTLTVTQGSIDSSFAGAVTLQATNWALDRVLNNTGVLTMGGSIDASALQLETEGATFVDVSGNKGTSGFARTAAYAVKLVNGGSTVNNQLTVKHGELDMVLGTDGIATAGGVVDYNTYYLNDSTASVSAIHGVDGASSASITQTGGVLTVDGAATVTTTGGTIVLNGGTLNGTVSGATINATSGALNATLSGTNTLNGNNYALGNVIANQGTLTIGGSFDASALTLNTTAATHVDVAGNSGASGFAKDAFYDVSIATGTVVNNGATVTHGQHTLTLGADGVATAGGAIDYSNYLLTGSDTATTSAIHGVEGASAATVTQNGGTLTVDDTVTVNGTGGAITLNGGTLNGSLQGMTIDAVQGTLGATLTGTNTLIGHDFALDTPLDNQGTLVLNGTFDLSGMTPTTTAATHVDVNGASGASGFAKTELQEVAIATGGTINASGATFTHNGHTLTLGEGGVASVGGEVDYSKYLLTGSDTVSSSAIHGVAGAANATVTQNGGTLTVDDTVTVTTTGGTIVLNGGTLNGTVSGATINATSGTIGATLSGANTLNGNNYALGNVIANNGPLTIGGTFDASALTLNTTNATHIDVNGTSGTSGFAKDAFYDVTIATGTVVNNGATVTHGQHTLTLGADGVATAGGVVDYSTYFLHNGAEVAVSAIRAIPEAADAKVNMDGGKLNADADVFVTAMGGRIEVSHGADVAGSIRDTQIAIHGCEISADITGNSSVYVDGDTILSGHNTYTGNTEVHEGGYLTVSGSITSDVYLYAGTLDTATGMTLASGQDVFFRGGMVKGNVSTASGSGLNLNQDSTLDGSLTLGGGTLTLSNGAVLTVSGSLTLDTPTKLVGDWAPDHVYTLAEAGSITNNCGNLNEFFAVDAAVGTVKQEGNRLILEMLEQTAIAPDETDIAVVNSLWGSLSSVRDFARLAEQQHLIGAPGQTVLWAGAFGSFSDVSDAHPFKVNSGGYAVGAQQAFTESFRCGVALGQSTGTVESKGAARIKDDQKGMMAALTLQYEQALKGRNRALINGYAALGRVENDAKGAVNANWDDTVLSIGGRASVAMACGEHTWAIPFVGLEWSRAQQGSFSRADGGRYSDGEMSLLTLPVGVTLRSEERFADGVVFAPELTLAYEANLAKDAPQGTRRMGTKSCTAEGYDPGAGSFMVNGAFNVLLNEHWSVGASYTLRMADQSVNHGMNASVRYAF